MYKIAVIEDDTLLGQALVEMLVPWISGICSGICDKSPPVAGETAGGSAF